MMGWAQNIEQLVDIAVLMIMASHQTFSSQFKYLTGQTKFGQTYFLYIINGKVIEFLIEQVDVLPSKNKALYKLNHCH